jgi:hypothetical protein
MNNNLSPETIEHQKTTRYGVGKSRSWLGTGTTNMAIYKIFKNNKLFIHLSFSLLYNVIL